MRGEYERMLQQEVEPQICLEVLGDLTDKPLKRQLADQQLSGFLVLPDLTQSDGSRPVSVRLQTRKKTMSANIQSQPCDTRAS